MPLPLYRNRHYRNSDYDTANVLRKCDSCTPAVRFIQIEAHGQSWKFFKKRTFFWGKSLRFPQFFVLLHLNKKDLGLIVSKKNKNGDSPRGHYIKAAYAVPSVAGYP